MQRGLQLFLCVGLDQAHIAHRTGLLGDLVQRAVGVGLGPDQRGARHVLGHVARLQHLVREFIECVAAQLRRGTRMRGAALHVQRGRSNACRGQQQRLALHDHRARRRLAGQHYVVLLREFCNGVAGTERAHFLIRVEQHGDLRIVLPPGRLEDRQRMQDDRDAALVVGDAGAVQAVAVQFDRLGGQRVGPVDRVHMRDQHDAALAGAGQRALDHGAWALRHGDALSSRAQRLEACFCEAGHLRQAGRIGAAGLDRHHVLERLDQRGLGRAGGVQQLRVRGAGAAGCPACERERCHSGMGKSAQGWLHEVSSCLHRYCG